jgi:hypothetical protein
MKKPVLMSHNGGVWWIKSIGRYENGTVLCHLVNTTTPEQREETLDADLVERAMGRPSGFLSWAPALQGAFNKGLHAAETGATPDACPYTDKRKHNGRLTWSRSFVKAWHDGFNHSSTDCYRSSDND